ncbi:hypothetical protein B0H10DRAFT_2245919 [Mycena sp. CBHHK59/15]|nr:hypothetical protein B0H10DRAFT_2245919 [Mycena sp. CBHHK59/15]
MYSSDAPPASQNSPSSPAGVHRSQRTPHRHTPYERHNNHYQLDGENFTGNSTSPSQPGGARAQYPAYTMPGSGGLGYDRTPFTPVNNYVVNPAIRVPSVATMVNVDKLSNDYGLGGSQRQLAHNFCKLPDEDRAVTMYMRLLHTEEQNNAILQELQDTNDRISVIGQYCTQNWTPSKAQEKLLKSLLKHFIIRPISSYSNLTDIAKTYVFDHAKRLRLELYKEDPTVKEVVNDFLTAENNTVRSALRKAVFASVKEKSTLSAFGKKIVNTYHLPVIPHSAPDNILACLALMRKTAGPLAKKPTQRGGDTGFWATLEAALDDLFKKNGNSRESEEWLKWEKDIIAEDDAKYIRYGAETSARTRDEIDAAMSSQDPRDDSDDEDYRDGRNVNMSQLGDLGSLGVSG